MMRRLRRATPAPRERRAWANLFSRRMILPFLTVLAALTLAAADSSGQGRRELSAGKPKADVKLDLLFIPVCRGK